VALGIGEAKIKFGVSGLLSFVYFSLEEQRKVNPSTEVENLFVAPQLHFFKKVEQKSQSK